MENLQGTIETGFTYTDEIGREIERPIQGGSWCNGQQWSGTCDAPYRHFVYALVKNGKLKITKRTATNRMKKAGIFGA